MKNYDLKIDFSDYSSNRNNLVKNIFYNEQDVNTAFINATLLNKGQLLDLEGYNNILAAIRKNDDTKVLINCNIKNPQKGEIDIPFNIQSLKSIGVNNFQIILSKGNTQMVSPKFYYNVDEALIGNDDIESSSEYPTLVLLISQTEELIKNNNLLSEKVNALNDTLTENENIRQDQESQRESQEQERQTSIANMKTQVDDKLEEIQGQVDTTLTEKVEEVDGKIAEVDTAKNNMTNQVNEKIAEVNTAKNSLTTQVNEKITEVNNKIIEVDTAKNNMVGQVNTKIEEFTATTNENTKKIDDKIVDIQKQLDTKTTEKFTEVDETLNTKVSEKFTEVDETLNTKVSEKFTEVDTAISGKLSVVETQEIARQETEKVRQTKEGERQTSIVNMKKQVDDKIVEFEGKFNDMANSNVAGEVTLARISKDGTEHSNLSERLSHDYDELLKSIGENNEDPTKISSFYKVLTTNDWVLGEDGFYTVDIAHPLKSEDLIVTAIDSTTKDSYDLAHKALNDDSVRIISTSALNCNLSILSTKSQTIDVSGLDLSNYATKDNLKSKADSNHAHKSLSRVLASSNTSTENKDKYTKLATFDITRQYGFVASNYNIIVGGHGAPTTEHSTLNVWIKNQSPLGEDGIMKLTVANESKETINHVDFYLVEVSKTESKNTYELYAYMKSSYMQIALFELGTYSNDATTNYHVGQPFIDSLPNGRNIKGVDIANKHNHTMQDIEGFEANATNITFDKNGTDLTAQNVQTAIVEINNKSNKSVEALSKAEANEASILQIQEEIGTNRATLESNVVSIKEVL